MTHIEELTGSAWSGNRASPAAMPDDGWHVLASSAAAAPPLHEAWDMLARDAALPNPFCEPCFLLPALRRFDPDVEVRLAMLVRGGKLAGLMPLLAERHYHRHRLPHLANWLHDNAFCGAPLILPGAEREFWDALLVWADRAGGAALFLDLAQMPEDAPACRALIDLCAEQQRPCRIVDREPRALLRRGPTVEEHLAAALPQKKRKELRRQQRRLAELGALTIERRSDAEGLPQWIAHFLTLEAGGWKGAARSALSSDVRTEALFRDSITGFAAAGRLERLALLLDGRPVAMLASFVTPPGAYSFKTAFDEDYARFSPGVLLQLANLAMLERPDIAWTDSCAAAGHPMIEHLWRDRRMMIRLTVGIGSALRRRIGGAVGAIQARTMEEPA